MSDTDGVHGIRIEVDPQELIRAGDDMASVGKQLDKLMDALRAVLSSGLASGVDLPGINMAFAYGNGAQEFSNGLAVAANALKAAGIKLQATGHNYANADTISTIGGAAPTGSADTDFDKTDPAEAKRFPNSSIVPPPAAWYVVEHLIPIVNPLGAPGASWPSGNPSMLRLTAWQWRNLANGFQPLSDRLRRGKTAVSTQKIPESSRIADMYDDLADGLAALAGLANEIATKIESFAQQVQETQDAIRRLLDRLSPGGLLDTIKGIFTGDADDTLIQVARDIRTVLENQQRQVKAIVEALGHLTTEIGDAASRFQNWADKNLRELLGDQVGGVISGALTFYIDFRVGELTGLINSVAGTIALADVDTWIAMGETTLGIIQDPSTLDDFLITVGKEFIAWDELTGDHPGRGVGEAAFNIASLFTPGGGATKGGIVAKGVNQFRKAFGKLDLPSFKGPSFGSKFDGSLSINGSKVPDVPEVKPGLPESVITPGPFNRIDTPGHPVDAGVPSRPIDPPGSSSRPPVTGTAHPPGGGDGPPPPPPQRPVGPSDTGPHINTPPAHAPNTTVAHQPVPPVAGPPAHTNTQPGYTPPADHTPPQHAPQTTPPTTHYDAPHTPVDTGAHHQTHEPASANPPAAAHVPEHHTGGAGVSDHSATGHSSSHQPVADQTHHRIDQTHTPTEHHRTNGVEHPVAHNHNAAHTADTHTPHHAAAAHQPQPATAAMAPAVTGAGHYTPTTPHTPGPTHSAVDAHPPAGKTPSADTPRAHNPNGAAPGQPTAPAAPVKPVHEQTPSSNAPGPQTVNDDRIGPPDSQRPNNPTARDTTSHGDENITARDGSGNNDGGSGAANDGQGRTHSPVDGTTRTTRSKPKSSEWIFDVIDLLAQYGSYSLAYQQQLDNSQE